MSTQFPSNNPTAYLGLQATNPGQNWFRTRDPLPSDFRNYGIGDRWIHVDPMNPGLASIWALVSKSATAGFWSVLGSGAFAVGSLLTDDANLVNPIAGIIALTGNATQGVSTFMPVAGTAEVTIADATAAQKGVIKVNSVIHGVLLGTASQSTQSSTTAGTAGQFLISGGAGADPSWTSFVNTDASGIISMPSTSGASAYRSTNLTDQTGDLTVVTVLFDTEDYDTRSEYTPGTGIFKVTEPGLYLVNTVVCLNNIIIGNNVGNLAIKLNANIWWQTQYNPYSSKDAATQLSMMGSTVIKCAANDEITVTVQVGGGTKTVGILGATNVHTQLQVSKIA